jgi:diguanylate cyclase
MPPPAVFAVDSRPPKLPNGPKAPHGALLNLGALASRPWVARGLLLAFTADPTLRMRVVQTALASVMVLATALVVLYFVFLGTVQPAPALAWGLVSVGGMAGFSVAVRSGWSKRLHEPSMTVPQLGFLLACCAWAYALLGPARGSMFPVFMVVMTLGLFVVKPLQLAWISLYALLLFGATAAFMAWRDPVRYPQAIELGHFFMMAAALPVVAAMAGRLASMRARLRRRQQELSQALGQIRELATQDELTGLVNRRHMQQLVDQEHQRCVRSGQTFCLAKIDIDRFGLVNDTHSYAIGDAVLRAVAQEAQRHVRSCDMLARWGGAEFLLMLPEARATLVRGGLERLQQRLAALRIVVGTEVVGVTVSVGLSEHHAGETVAQSLERAGWALTEAKAARDRSAQLHPLAAARR